LRECDEFDEAITILRRLNLIEHNSNPHSLYQLANMLSLNEKVDQALIYYEKAREKAEAKLGGELVGGRLAREQRRILARLRNEELSSGGESEAAEGSGLTHAEEDDLELLFKICHNMAVSYKVCIYLSPFFAFL
jgi:tetratricopeptide (TPR) repeat protein